MNVPHLNEFKRMHGRYVKNKYTFFHKVVYKLIAFTYSYLKMFLNWNRCYNYVHNIFSSKHGIYDLPPELPNNLRLRILGN